MTTKNKSVEYINVDEFTKFHKLLMQAAPEGYNPFYLRCAKESKEPELKVGSWKKNPLSFEQACGWLRNGGNVGIAGRDEDQLVLIDIDDENVTDYKSLKPTLTVRSGGRRGVHLFRFEQIPGTIPNIPTEDAGEVRANYQFVIAPGSYVSGYSFRINSGLTGDLDKGILSEELKNEFNKNGHELTEKDDIIKDGENKWNLIHKRDDNKEDKFIARAEDRELIFYVGGVPKDSEIPNLGKYTIEVAIPVNEDKITIDELPRVFRDKLEKNKEAERIERERKVRKKGGEDKKKVSAFFDLTVRDIISSVPNPYERFPSIFHGSKTGKNTSISNQGLIQCWRHNVSLNAQQVCAVLSGELTCLDAGTPHKHSGAGPSLYTDNDKALFAAWECAKENGFIPKDDPIPTRAMCYIAVENGFCNEKDIKGGWKLPLDAYNKVLAYLEDKGLEPGREEGETKEKKKDEEPKKEFDYNEWKSELLAPKPQIKYIDCAINYIDTIGIAYLYTHTLSEDNKISPLITVSTAIPVFPQEVVVNGGLPKLDRVSGTFPQEVYVNSGVEKFLQPNLSVEMGDLLLRVLKEPLSLWKPISRGKKNGCSECVCIQDSSIIKDIKYSSLKDIKEKTCNKSEYYLDYGDKRYNKLIVCWIFGTYVLPVFTYFP